MNNPIPGWIQRLWNEWDIRVIVLLSLILQIILFAIGRYRRRSTSILISSTVWLSYLSADLVAIVALGKLSDVFSKKYAGQIHPDPNDILRALWAPMLLLHLGGPDTIIAYSVNDSRLWIRHLLGLAVHSAAAIYVVFCCWDADSWLSILTIPTFIAGLIKYSERSLCLWFANSKKPGEFASDKYDALLEKTDGVPGVKWLVVAYFWHQALKPSLHNFIGKIDVVGLTKYSIDSIELEHNADNIFRIIEAELGFVYDEVFTKSALIYTGASCLLRSVGFMATVAVLVGFSLISKSDYSNVDVVITFVLLGAAVALEFYAFLLMIWSDWGVIWIVRHLEAPLVSPILSAVAPFIVNQKRWSRCIAQLNLLELCKQGSDFLDRILGIVGMEDKYQIHRCKRKVKGEGMLRDIKKMTLEGAGKILAQIDDLWKFDMRGELTLQGYEAFKDLKSIFEKGFDEFIICWHLATEICIHRSTKQEVDKTIHSQIEKAKIMSDYMMYLLASKPRLLRISTGNVFFRNTCKVLRDVYKVKGDGEKFFEARESVTRKVQGETGCLVLNNAWELANFMFNNYPYNMWEIIGDVWVEMMCYGAANCQVSYHVEQLNEGGEWLTHVWLLLTILGLSDKVSVERANLRIECRERIAPGVDHIFNHPYTSGGHPVGCHV